MSRLLKEVRSMDNLYRAWSTVRSNVMASGRVEFKKEVRQIAENPTKRLSKIQRQLQRKTFVFKPQIARVKDRKRPIVVSPIDNRIVQRAILNVLQSQDDKLMPLLGSLPEVVRTENSVGGNPKKGVSDGIDIVKKSIDLGAVYYIKSDIEKFFTKIPKKRVVELVNTQTKDQEFSDLLFRALETELENEDEVKEWLHLFPVDDIGVPQGSSLSAYAGNLILGNFDRQMTGRGITTVRYIDDFVMLGSNPSSLAKAFETGIKILEDLGMSAYRPKDDKEKASSGKISDGFEFLGCSVRGKQISPSSKAQGKVMESIDAALREGIQKIQEFGNLETSRRAEATYAQTLVRVDRVVRGWGDSFAFCTDRMPFAKVDKKIDQSLGRFRSRAWKIAEKRSSKQKRRIMGVALLGDTPREKTSRRTGATSF